MSREDAMRLTRYILIHGAKPVAERPYIEQLPPGTEIYKADEVRAAVEPLLKKINTDPTVRFELRNWAGKLLQEIAP